MKDLLIAVILIILLIFVVKLDKSLVKLETTNELLQDQILEVSNHTRLVDSLHYSKCKWELRDDILADSDN